MEEKLTVGLGKRLRVMAAALPLLGRLSWRLVRDPRVPRAHRAVLVAAVGYLASPIDLLPDAIPLLGEVDDLLVLAAGLGWLLNFTPGHVLDDHLVELGVTREELDKTLTSLLPLPLVAAYRHRHRYLPALADATEAARLRLDRWAVEGKRLWEARRRLPSRSSGQSPV